MDCVIFSCRICYYLLLLNCSSFSERTDMEKIPRKRAKLV